MQETTVCDSKQSLQEDQTSTESLDSVCNAGEQQQILQTKLKMCSVKLIDCTNLMMKIKTELTEIKTEPTEIKTEPTEIKTEPTEIKTEPTEEEDCTDEDDGFIPSGVKSDSCLDIEITSSTSKERLTAQTLSCTTCGKTFSSQRHLERHERKHTEQKLFTRSEISFTTLQEKKLYSEDHREKKKKCGKITMVDKWTVDDTCQWLQNINLIDAKETFRDQQIDGETLLGLTERMVERLFPIMKHQVTFMKELNKLKNLETGTGTDVPQMSCIQQEPCDPIVAQPCPAVYNLPVFPPELQAALQRKDPSFKKKDKSHIRALLVQVLFDSITKHTWYPSHKIYGDVLGSLITRFPFLKDGSRSGYDTLLECLRNKFKKERIPLVSSSIVMEMKEKYGIKRKSDRQTDSQNQHQKNAKCRREPLEIMAYNDSACSEIVLDLELSGEEETSFQQHINAITLELRKSNPNYSEVKNRMKRTLFQRVQMMERPASEVMEQFPFLGVPQLMLHEMTMRFGTDLVQNMETSLNKMAPNIIRSAKEGTQKKLYANLISTAEKTTEGLVRNAALILLPALFKENANFLYCVNSEPKGPTPTIVFNGSPDPLKAESVSIVMDNVTIIKEAIIDMTQAVECLFAVYFLFNVHYPVAIKHTMTFIQKYMLKFKCRHEKKTPIPVQKMYNQLL
ncbi:sterile alpha motif domain-containing protein 3 isoform X3 [Misgurnus anguillicaudatus]|uniref:sterile alpha motif domain-containing protein 3 isoform X3 n=1 Tax=Misgurnus anguillicaudatus TaxID=75329 RepID=UPI003CCF22CF